MAYPNWVLKHKKKGTEIRLIAGRYYLYKITSKWNPQKKQTQKITLGLIGAITKEGLRLTEDRKKERAKRYAITTLEYGATEILRHIGKPIEYALGKFLGEDAKEVYVCALTRVVEKCALKHIKPLYMSSYISQHYPNLALSSNQLSNLLHRIGRKREAILAFFRHFLTPNPHILFDATHITSHSKEMGINERGYNSKKCFDEQTNLLYMFSIKNQQPAYYRVIPGNIREISAFKLCIEELGTKYAIVVADKGFVSKKNVEFLQAKELKCVLPLRRNSTAIDYSKFLPFNYKSMDGSFMYQKRCIWYISYRSPLYGTVFLFYDGRLAESERQDYMTRVHNEIDEYTVADFQKKHHCFGSLALVTNIPSLKAEEVYGYYKGRMAIEKMFDTFKNTLSADKTYMRGQEELEAWLFINHIAMMLHYNLYDRLQKAGLFRKYAPMDILLYGKQIRKNKIGKQWYTSEISTKFKKVLDALDLPVT